MGCTPSKSPNQNVIDSHVRPQSRPEDNKQILVSTPVKREEDSPRRSPGFSEIPAAKEPLEDTQSQSREQVDESPSKAKEDPAKSPAASGAQKTKRFRPKSAGVPFSEPTGLKISYEKASQLNPKDPDEMWAIVNKTSDREGIQVEPTKNRKGWRTIRVFVSSTFKDFHPEREVLVKEVCTHYALPSIRL